MLAINSSNEHQKLSNDKLTKQATQQENEDDLEHFDWAMAIKQDRNEKGASQANEEENIEGLLGDFLARMNK